MALVLSKYATQRLLPLPITENSCNAWEGETACQSMPDNKLAYYDFANRPEDSLLVSWSTVGGPMPIRW